jgi:enoyl-CoA hydratase
VSDLVTVRTEGAVAVLTHDDGKANAYSHAALDALGAALDEAEAAGARAVLLTGRDGVFSAGFDLKTMTAGEAEMRALVAQGARFLGRLFTFGAPVVVAVPGHALAAGALVLLSADVRIGADVDKARIGLNEVAIGMPLPRFAIDLARYRMPPSQFDGALLGRTSGPAGAVVAGYLDRVVPAADLLEAALAEASALAELSAGAVAHTKRSARGAIVDGFLADLERELGSIGGPG